MGIEKERCNAKRQDRDPKINQMWYKNCERCIKKHDQRSHAQINTWSGET